MILTNGFPISNLCLPVEVILESDAGLENGYSGNGDDDDDS